ncbi:MAG: hypothetical protein JO024_03815 [Candidatus Eremiobacteraeota bacterium]|nr:hypothetical protein [Candidatus Eremiobacteraeota bacterium]
MINQRLLERLRLAKRGLRFDQVALRFIERLQNALEEAVPAGKTLIVIVTAPIRMPAKTAAAVEERISNFLAQGPKRRDFRDTINENEVWARLAPGVVRGQSRVMAFVQNPDADSDALLSATQALLAQMTA